MHALVSDQLCIQCTLASPDHVTALAHVPGIEAFQKARCAPKYMQFCDGAGRCLLNAYRRLTAYHLDVNWAKPKIIIS